MSLRHIGVQCLTKQVYDFDHAHYIIIGDRIELNPYFLVKMEHSNNLWDMFKALTSYCLERFVAKRANEGQNKTRG